ncbi:MAG: 16S rRNA (cytosine(967)-C(5))-methyltransferase RsmB [Lachnospiraceae bacterium]|nr:16S rRNA (cytosine(967)-C(5))-methyltransferase RsmB [Lachnospiraceae bacterium]
MSTRSVALENIILILENGRPLHLVLADCLKTIESENDRAFVSRLTRGVVERKSELDEIIRAKSSVKPEKQKPVIRNILRSGIYQILYMDSVTDFAACDESVKLAGKRGFRSLGGFVNGVLRNICRDEELRSKAKLLQESLPDEDASVKTEEAAGENKADEANDNTICSLSEKYSMPEWITKDWVSRFGAEKSEKAFKYFMTDKGIQIRCNLSKISAGELEKRFISAGISYRRNIHCDKWFSLYKFRKIEENKEYKEGLFVIQDLSSGLSGLIDRERINIPQNGEVKVLDLCAAPGGKSLHMADYGYKVTACDLSVRKTDMIRSAAKRCGMDNIEVIENDAAILNKAFIDKYDIVLCDLPCSGLGIIGKKPDIKYNITPEKQKELVQLQRIILDNAVKYLKIGGIMIYSTCTVNSAENEEQAAYIAAKKGMKAEAVLKLPKGMNETYQKDKMLQLLPGEFGTDGFFFASFRRNE